MERFRGYKGQDSKETVSVGAGLLNAASKELEADLLKIVQIRREDIEVSQNNFYSIANIDSLKQSIVTIGLKQPLMVHKKDNGKYKLLGGERRLTALDELIAEGKWNQPIPCVVQDYDKVKMPVSDEMKEMYCIITTNREQRDYTDADLANEIKELRKLYAELRKSGADDIIIGIGEDGNEIKKIIKGVKTKNLIAKDLKISSGRVASFDKVENNGSEELKQALSENRISIVAAEEALKLSKEEQKRLLEESDGEIKLSDVKSRVDIMKKEEQEVEVSMDIKALAEIEEFMSFMHEQYDKGIKEISAKDKASLIRFMKGIKNILS